MRLSPVVPFVLTSILAGCSSSATNQGSNEPQTKTTKQAVCDIHSGYQGDEYCLPPPDPSEGIQIHVGPASYDDPDAVAPFLVDVGKENVACFNAAIPGSDFFYLRQVNHMRTGSHHMLITVRNDTTLQPGPSSACDITGGLASIPGSQTPTREFPDKLGPEDEGIGRYLPQSNMAAFQLHYINTMSEPELREAWVNLYKKPEAEVTQRLQSVFMVGDFAINIAPHTQQTTTLDFTPTLPSETRVFELNAHIHAHTQGFTVWKIHGGQEDVIYQSFNWEDPLENTYNSIVHNPAQPHAGPGRCQGRRALWSPVPRARGLAPLGVRREQHTRHSAPLRERSAHGGDVHARRLLHLPDGGTPRWRLHQRQVHRGPGPRSEEAVRLRPVITAMGPLYTGICRP
jgi:hypothetical protein